MVHIGPYWLARPPKRHPRQIRQAAHAKVDADMSSQALQDVIDALRDRQKASVSQAPPTLERRNPHHHARPGPLDIRIINAATGDLIRELTLDTTRNYQPSGRPPGPRPEHPAHPANTTTPNPDRRFGVIPIS